MKITILDPALCCSTGVCGPSVDDTLVQTAANVKWLKSLGYEVKRHNISNDGAAFKEYPDAIKKLQEEGVDSLPYIFINDKLVKAGEYPSKEEWLQLLETKTSQTSGKTHFSNENFAEKTNVLIGIGAAVAASNETFLKQQVSRAKVLDIEIQEIARAMNIGNDAKNSLSKQIITQANRLLGELQPTADSCAPNSGCC
ncbi:arsenite efflux transporter metallochaperone ArsD [Antarcticibacterium arcticum]|uniref:Arsenite efflux transporter metallochaperone ArsD n=1 Tax=Antarcticibacterium arcticum TaxID=2585771 RepID=A0A5B8YI02_9FLAO|nr:arsenite efflux transporter metallochaperone ArsD [Antarcticibacterium arcticum]QED36658.1 arsenite efflux transporter metallochaperone ArsD [Antarcticibacterium arcticum]